MDGFYIGKYTLDKYSQWEGGYTTYYKKNEEKHIKSNNRKLYLLSHFYYIVGFQEKEKHRILGVYLSKLEAKRKIKKYQKIKGFSSHISNFYSPLKGEVKLLEEAEDEAFASGALGKGTAVVPVEGKVVAPVDGTIVTLFPTNHVIAIETNSGVEILIHVGLDTVQLDGKYFHPKVKEGDKIKKGDLMLEFAIDEIKKAGYVLTTPIIVTNTDEYLDILEMKKENVEFGDELITIVK